MAESLAIETSELRKNYGPVEALRGLDLSVPPGSIFGFLGRNGAGKTTAMKILLGMVRADGGSARVCGLDAISARDSIAIRRLVAFADEEKDLYLSMTVEGMIRFTRAFYPGWRQDLEEHYRRAFELRPDQEVKNLSRGTRTKVALLLVLCSGARVLMLDEPTSGLDPAAAEAVLQALVNGAAEQGTTVFFSSHQIAEVEQIADHIAIIDRGRAVVAGELEDLRLRYRRIQLVFSSDAPTEPLRTPGVVRTWREGRSLTLLSSAGAELVVQEARAFNPVSVDVTPVTLKEIFLEAVQEN
jgi:ABC-2 type transport system ATP-binding protein